MEYSGLRPDESSCVASRIMRGLGLRRQDMAHVASAIGVTLPDGPAHGAVAILSAVSGGLIGTVPGHGEFLASAVRTDRSHSAVSDLELLTASASSESGGAILFSPAPPSTRPRLSWAYVVCREGMDPPWVVEPPAVLLAGHMGFNVWYRESSDLVSSMRRRLHWEVPCPP